MSREILLPGGVDVHTHNREPGAEHKGTFKTESMDAAMGGIVLMCDMPNNPGRPTVTPETLSEKMAIAGSSSYVDVGFHFGGTKESSQYFQEVIPVVTGLKVYMNHTTGELLVEEQDDLEAVFSAWEAEKPIIVHAEGPTVFKAIELARKFNRALHIAHVSQKLQIEAIKEAREDGLDVSCEVSAHHLLMNERDAFTQLGEINPYRIMRPPLAEEEDRRALWDNLEHIDMVASDHAPHTVQDKKAKGASIPNGIPGVATTIPLLIDQVNKGNMTIGDVIRLTHDGPIKRFGLEVLDNSYSIVDLDAQTVVRASRMHSLAGWSSFEGWMLSGRVVETVLAGETIFRDGHILGAPRGRVVSGRLDGDQ